MERRIGSFVAFSVFVVAISLAGQAQANTYCMVQDAANEIMNITFYGCVQSTNYMKDLEQAPENIFAVTFSHSDIPVLKDRSFDRFTEALTIVGMDKVGLRNIENDAFQGATGVVMIALTNNKLEVIKGEWFRDLPHLMTVSFQNNLIHTIEGSFFTTVKSLDELELFGNKLTTLPQTEVQQFTVEELGIKENPWTEETTTWLTAWMNEKNVTEHDMAKQRNVIGDEIVLDTTKYTPVTLPASTETSAGNGETNDALTNVEINSKDDFCKFINEHPNLFYVCGPFTVVE